MERTKPVKKDNQEFGSPNELPFNYAEELVIEAFKSTGFLIVNKKLIQLFGLIGATVLSNYIDKYQYFKHNSNDNFDGWFFLRHKDIMDQLQLKENAIVTAKHYFIKLGFLLTKKKGIPSKEWIFINFEVLIDYVFNSDTALDPQKTRALDPQKTRGLINNTKYNKTKKSLFVTTTKKGAEQFEIFWSMYPKDKKGSKGKTMKSWNSICNKNTPPNFSEIKQSILEQSKSNQWQVEKYIPLPVTWLNQSRWLDDPKELKNYDKDFKSNGKKPSNVHQDGVVRNYT
jgi:hypothetical protein